MTIRRRVARCDDDIDRRVARDVWERVAVFARSGARARRRGGARGRDARAVGASSPGAGARPREIERLTDRVRVCFVFVTTAVTVMIKVDWTCI